MCLISLELGHSSKDEIDGHVVEIGFSVFKVRMFFLCKHIIKSIKSKDLAGVYDVNSFDCISKIAWNDTQLNLFVGVWIRFEPQLLTIFLKLDKRRLWRTSFTSLALLLRWALNDSLWFIFLIIIVVGFFLIFMLMVMMMMVLMFLIFLSFCFSWLGANLLSLMLLNNCNLSF